MDYSDIPKWFEEGVCEYIGYDKTNVEFSPFQITPFNELTNADQWRNAQSIENSNVYGQSHLAINFLIDHFGETIINDILEETKLVDDFNQGFEKVKGMSIIELENEIRSNDNY